MTYKTTTHRILEKHFARAGLPLEILRHPAINPYATDIFQLDIRTQRRGNRRKETFRVWTGNSENRVEVFSTERKLRQLTLFVHEASRRFELTLSKSQPLARGDRVIRVGSNWKRVERWTPSAQRRYLCGLDERHLFIAQYSRGNTVEAARESLRGEIEGGTLRQGEWFFIPLSRDELDRLRRDARRFAVLRKEPLGPGGRPHVADEVIRIPGTQNAVLFARGRVRHVEHRTVRLREWHRVIRNMEVVDEANGVGWVD
jgi:hypothetical protein